MKINITDKNENAPLKRTELVFSVDDAKVPPARKELRDKIAALQNVKPEQVIVSKIGHNFGSREIKGTAKIYATVADLEKTELQYMVERNTGRKKKGGEGQAPPESTVAEAGKKEPVKEEAAKREDKAEKKAEEKEGAKEEGKEKPEAPVEKKGGEKEGVKEEKGKKTEEEKKEGE